MLDRLALAETWKKTLLLPQLLNDNGEPIIEQS